MKTLGEHFRDWESEAVGYGYGTGESHTVPAVRQFLELCRVKEHTAPYDYRELEAAMSPTVVWLLISILARDGIIEYGTSPRFGWLTLEGGQLRDFMLARSADELIDIVNDREQDYIPCLRCHCNCSQDGVCPNPFWRTRRT
jgi:hypothetical protein